MKFSYQQQQILRILEDGQYHCVVRFTEGAEKMIDYRKRLSELQKEKGLVFENRTCRGRCGRVHRVSGLKQWRWPEKDVSVEIIDIEAEQPAMLL